MGLGTTRGVGRRRAIAAVVAAAGVAALIGTAPLSSLAAAGTDPDGSVRIGVAGPINSLDPHLATTTGYPTWTYPIYDRLFKIDGNDDVVPMLAESVDFATDGSTATLSLRDDVVFHDGTPVGAEAVKASLERGQALEGSTVAALLEGVVAIEVVDDHTVTLTLDGIGAELPALLATNAGVVINPGVLADASADLDAAPPAGAGSGPYTVVESEPSVETSYERAPEYWDSSAGLMQSFSITYLSSAAGRLAGLRAGDFDLVVITPDVFAEATTYADAGEFTMVTTPAANRDVLLNVERGDLADIEVRRALSLAINRDEIDLVQPCLDNSQPQREGHWAFNPDVVNVYDPDAAAEIIADRGGASIELTYAAGTASEQAATVLQAQFTSIGVDVTMRGVDQGQVLPLFTSGEAEAALASVTPGPDPVEALNRYFLGGAGIARGAVGEELRTLAEPAIDPGLSEDERAAIYRDAYALIAENYLYLPVCQTVQGWASTIDLIGVDAMPGMTRGVPDFTSIGVAAG